MLADFPGTYHEKWPLEGAAEAVAATACLPNADEAADCAAGWSVHALAGNRPLEDRLMEAERLAKSHRERSYQCDLIRDIFANPFKPRPAIDPSWLRWGDGTVYRLAQSIYEGRRFGDMSILHDALLDAGCDDEDILDHCKSPGPHVRGCWVLDLCLGKQ